MQVFTQAQCAALVSAFDALPKCAESDTRYYSNSSGVFNLEPAMAHVPRLTELVHKRFPGAVFQNLYVREYRAGGQLRPHTDRAGLDITMSVCLEKSTPSAYPLVVSSVQAPTPDVDLPESEFSKYETGAKSFDMAPGVGVVMEGRKYPHWRPALDCAPDERAVYIFFHWSYGTTKSEEPMTLDSKYTPAIKLLKPDAELHVNFLSEAECALMIYMAQDKLARSTITNTDGSPAVADHRTSYNTSFRRGDNAILQRIEARIAELVGIPESHGEGLQVLRYSVGEQYKPHNDYFEQQHHSADAPHLIANNRICTVLLYLNTVAEGGETYFPDAGVTVYPKAGSALVFRYPTPTADTLTLHAALPVIRGTKWVSTKWIHKEPY